MFKNKVQRYSIRKLTVGAASVLIGMAFLTNGNQAKAEESNNGHQSNDDVVKENHVQHADSVKSADVKNVVVTKANTNQSAKNENTEISASQTANNDSNTLKINNKKTDDANKIAQELSESKAQTPTANTNKQENTDTTKSKAADTFNVTINTVNDFTGQGMQYWDKKNGGWKDRNLSLTNVKDGTQIDSIEAFATLPGYKLLNPEALEQNFKIDTTQSPYYFNVNGKDANVTLHYAPLSDIKVEYVDEATGTVLASSNMPSWKMTTESYTHAHGRAEAPDANKYEAAAISIPGYELVSDPFIEGKFGDQIKTKENPNPFVLTFKYKKVMKNEDSIATVPPKSSHNSFGAPIDGGWDDIPGKFEISGVYGLKNSTDMGDVEQKAKDLIARYEKQGSTYVGTDGKLYNNDPYNYFSFGYDLYLIPNKPVTVQYVDENGKALAPEDTIAFNHDNPDQTNQGVNEAKYWTPAGTWTTKPKEIDGYYLVKTKGAETGNFTAFNYITTYVYAKKVSGQVAYIDDTTKKTLATDPLAEAKPGDKIDYTTAKKVQDYLNKGYKLVSNNFKDGNEVYQKDGNNFEIHLVHDYVPVEPKNPGKPGEPINPNDPEGPKYPNNTDAKSLTKIITRTVDYVDENGKSLVNHPTSETVTLSASGVLDKVTGEWATPEGLKWNSSNFDAITTPDIPTYHVTGVTTEGNIYYDIDQATGNVSSTPVTHENGDTKVIVHLSRNEVNGTVTYIDDTTGKTLKTDEIGKGKIGAAITYTTKKTIDNYVDKGYQLKKTNFVDGKMHYQKDGNNYEVHLVHDYVPVEPKNPGKPGEPINPNDPEGPKYPNGTDAKSLTKTITRTVDYVDENGNSLVDHPASETVTLSASGVLDKVTGEWTTPEGLKWNSSNFNAITTPSIPTYHVTGVTTEGNIYYDVDQATGNVAATPVTHENGDTKVIVHLSREEVNGTVKYIDDTTGKTLKTDEIGKGKIGSKITYTTKAEVDNYLNKGYQLKETNFVDGKMYYQKDGNNYEVHLVHQLIPVDPKNPGKPGEPINPNDPEGPKFPEGTDDKSLTKEITRTVNYIDENGKSVAGSMKQTVTMTGAGILDKVTGEWTTPLQWKDGNFEAINTPSVSGYHVTSVTTEGNLYYNVDKNNGNVSSTKVTHNDGNTVVNVHFTKDTVAATGKITYIDDTTGKTLKTDDLKGNVGEKINYTTQDKIDNYENLGYKLVKTNFQDGAMTFAKEGNNFEVHFVHDLVPVTPQNPGKPGEPINPKNPEGPKFPEGTDNKSLTKEITRTVNYVDENGKSVSGTVTQKIDLSGQGILDKVTGEWSTPLTWNQGNFDAVTAPSVTGYHVTNVSTDGNIYYSVDNKGNVAETTVKSTSGNTTVTVHFAKDSTPVVPDTPVQSTGKIVYINDTTGQVMRTDEIKGNVGDKINYTTHDKIQNFTSNGYELVSSNFTDGQEVFAKGGNNFEIHFKENTPAPLPEQPTSPEPTNPVTPSVPDENVTPHPETPEQPTVPDKEENVAPHANEVPATPAKHHDETVTPHATKVAKNVAPKAQATNAAQLPQTGEDDTSLAGAAGLAMVSAISLIGLAGNKKRRKN